MTLLLSSVILRSLTVRWTTKNLKSIPSCSLRFFIPLRFIQNNILFFPLCHSEEFAERRMTKNLKNNSFFFLEILPRLRRVRMTLLLFPCHSKESHRKVDDEESKIHSFMLFEILHSASLHSE